MVWTFIHNLVIIGLKIEYYIVCVRLKGYHIQHHLVRITDKTINIEIRRKQNHDMNESLPQKCSFAIWVATANEKERKKETKKGCSNINFAYVTASTSICRNIKTWDKHEADCFSVEKSRNRWMRNMYWTCRNSHNRILFSQFYA